MKSTILLIEDSKTHIQVIMNLLEEFGFSAIHASNGLEGLKLAKLKKPDLILLDLVLPGIGGLEVCRWLKLDDETGKIPIIILTQKKSTEDKVAGLNMGANDYLTKPYQPEELKARILANLRSKEKEDLHFRENSQLLSLIEKVQEISARDPLTGLLNRKQLLQQLKTEVIRSVRYHLPLTLCLVDLDHLKRINERYGQPAGDIVLIETASLLRENFREIDFLGRYENDDFLIGLPQSTPQEALVPLLRLQKQISQHPFKGLDTDQRITVSTGVASLPAPDLGDAESLIKAAQRGLLKSKEKGENQTTVWTEILPGEMNEKNP